jgi:hypothetical protein
MEALESTETMGSETIWNEVAAVCWPGQEDQAAVWEVWLKQGIEFDSAPQMQCFILQHLNGPCGLIAPIQVTDPPHHLASSSFRTHLLAMLRPVFLRT